MKKWFKLPVDLLLDEIEQDNKKRTNQIKKVNSQEDDFNGKYEHDTEIQYNTTKAEVLGKFNDLKVCLNDFYNDRKENIKSAIKKAIDREDFFDSEVEYNKNTKFNTKLKLNKMRAEPHKKTKFISIKPKIINITTPEIIVKKPKIKQKSIITQELKANDMISEIIFGDNGIEIQSNKSDDVYKNITVVDENYADKALKKI